MQSMIQELMYQHQDKKGSYNTQDKRPTSSMLDNYKGNRNSEQSITEVPGTRRGIKSAGDIGGVVGGGLNFGGFTSPIGIVNRIKKNKDTFA